MRKTIEYTVADLLRSSKPFHKLCLEQTWNSKGGRSECDAQRWIWSNEKILR